MLLLKRLRQRRSNINVEYLATLQVPILPLPSPTSQPKVRLCECQNKSCQPSKEVQLK